MLRPPSHSTESRPLSEENSGFQQINEARHENNAFFNLVVPPLGDKDKTKRSKKQRHQKQLNSHAYKTLRMVIRAHTGDKEILHRAEDQLATVYCERPDPQRREGVKRLRDIHRDERQDPVFCIDEFLPDEWADAAYTVLTREKTQQSDMATWGPAIVYKAFELYEANKDDTSLPMTPPASPDSLSTRTEWSNELQFRLQSRVREIQQLMKTWKGAAGFLYETLSPCLSSSDDEHTAFNEITSRFEVLDAESREWTLKSFDERFKDARTKNRLKVFQNTFTHLEYFYDNWGRLFAFIGALLCFRKAKPTREHRYLLLDEINMLFHKDTYHLHHLHKEPDVTQWLYCTLLDYRSNFIHLEISSSASWPTTCPSLAEKEVSDTRLDQPFIHATNNHVSKRTFSKLLQEDHESVHDTIVTHYSSGRKRTRIAPLPVADLLNHGP